MASYQTHFTILPAPAEIDDDCDEIPELVEPGRILLSKQNEEKAAGTISLVAGGGTEANEEGTAISATAHGYPKLVVQSGAVGTTAEIVLLPLIQVSGDLMEARLNLFPPVTGSPPVTCERLVEILHQAEVLQNIDLEALNQAVTQVAESGRPLFDLIVARGRAPIHGRDAYLRMEIEIGPLPGKLLANGTIDFRERQMFVGVKEGQLIATKIPATQGKDGLNLAGAPIPATDGKNLTIKVAGDTIFNETDGTIRAIAAGVLSVVGKDTLRVASKQRIEGDVDFKTGNVRSQNSLEISGSVLPDFVVSAGGNLLICGNVQSGKIKCRGNLEIKGGIVGQESEVQARGDIDVTYIERGEVAAEGNIVIRKGCYYSSLQAGGSIHCPETVKLVGGVIIARGSLSAGQIGSSSSTPLSIAIGVDPSRYRRYHALKQQYQELLAQIQSQRSYYGQALAQERGDVTALESRMRQIEQELARLNLLPDSPELSLGETAYFFTDVTLKVHQAIAAGTKIRIGNDIVILERDQKGCTIRMDPVSGAIVITPTS